jgi:fucose 4-O-acetylase-like acetyltransferase
MNFKDAIRNKIIKRYNFGLGILKVFLAFDVIRSHNFNCMSTNNKIILFFLKSKRIHVPSFFMMSFYFMHKELISSNIKIYLKRIERLLSPYLLWPIIIFVLNNYFLYILFNIKIKTSFKDLKIQLLFGSKFISQFWFQWDLIIFTSIFFILKYFIGNNQLFFIQILEIFSYILQYSGYNKQIYNYLKPEKRLSIGRLTEMIPFSSSGFTLASLNIINYLQNYKIKTSAFCFSILFFLYKFAVFSELEGGVAYPGIILNIRAISLIILFSLFPSNKLKNSKLKK